MAICRDCRSRICLYSSTTNARMDFFFVVVGRAGHVLRGEMNLFDVVITVIYGPLSSMAWGNILSSKGGGEVD